ncbi:H-type small acid-soluble spore protein [Alkalihalobacillus hemicellulosilyticus]|uniref:Small, acid-soluble spore protein H n=1 Tax=Halalkalibacter hemicellulosilyticusJCM 9152 TaxID=1236971 RepID=W4QF90_9BACI|nr:H-type small acid-soluble spore protein [Halalkalibacter hemicellulosilyticus]GAE30592.1 acid-soluble spore protein H [Halalkalibacter hemicellulosilyticusJCM 9152]
MNTLRAKEISQSPDMKHVTYLDQQIYIQHVDEQNATARIFPLHEPGNEFDVNVDQLIEHH